MLTNTLIDRTNRFYIEMSRKVLSDKEYDILQKILIEKMTIKEVGELYNVTGEGIRRIYERTYDKVRSVTDLLAEIDHYKKKLQLLKDEFQIETGQLKKRKINNTVDLNKILYDSHFPLSLRMYNMFEKLDIRTVGELTAIPLKDFQCFRGFKGKCKIELIKFIEFENIEHLFPGFSDWKRAPVK